MRRLSPLFAVRAGQVSPGEICDIPRDGAGVSSHLVRLRWDRFFWACPLRAVAPFIVLFFFSLSGLSLPPFYGALIKALPVVLSRHPMPPGLWYVPSGRLCIYNGATSLICNPPPLGRLTPQSTPVVPVGIVCSASEFAVQACAPRNADFGGGDVVVAVADFHFRTSPSRTPVSLPFDGTRLFILSLRSLAVGGGAAKFLSAVERSFGKERKKKVNARRVPAPGLGFRVLSSLHL